jgi:hypothetical protein
MATKKLKPGAEAANDAAEAPGVLPASAPSGTDLMTEATTACEAVVAVTINSPMMYELAAVELVDLQAALKKLNDQRFSITRPMDAAKTAVMNLFRMPTDLVESKIKAVKAGMLAYDQEQKKKAAAQQAILDRIAADQRAQLAAEAQRQSDLAAAEHARANELMQAGNTEGVADALNRAEEAHNTSLALQQTTGIVTAATAATNVPTVDGITTADVWKARVTDTAALLRFIADNPQYHDWIEFKMAGLNELAKAQRTELRIPGVEPFEESRIAAARIRKAA